MAPLRDRHSKTICKRTLHINIEQGVRSDRLSRLQERRYSQALRNSYRALTYTQEEAILLTRTGLVGYSSLYHFDDYVQNLGTPTMLDM